MNKKKILIFTFSLGGGGVQRFLINLIQNLNLENYDLCIALVNKKGVYLDSIPNEIRLVDLKAKRIHFSLIPLIKCIKNEKPDILFSINTTINLVAILAKIITRSKFKLITRQAVDFKDLSVSKYKLFLVKMLYHKVDRCVALTWQMKTNIIYYTKLKSNEITVIYNAININNILEKREKKAEELINIEVPKIITVGRLAKQKNISMLIDAFNLVLKEKKAKLIILGEGEEKENLESKIAEKGIQNNVLMLGYQFNPYKYIYQSDVFVLPSLFEGLSNAMLEALACEIPIVTTDNPDGIIKDGVNGFHAKLTSEDIAIKINMLLCDNSLRNHIIANNNQYRSEFNISTMVDRYEDLFNFM